MNEIKIKEIHNKNKYKTGQFFINNGKLYLLTYVDGWTLVSVSADNSHWFNRPINKGSMKPKSEEIDQVTFDEVTGNKSSEFIPVDVKIEVK